MINLLKKPLKDQIFGKEVKETLDTEFILAIAGNKDDKEDKNEDVDEDEAREYAKKLNAKFKMVSAKTNAIGFIDFLKELVIDYINKIGEKNNNKNIILSKKKFKKKKKKC